MTTVTPNVNSANPGAQPGLDPREAALRQRYAAAWKLATDVPGYAKVVQLLGLALFGLAGLVFLSGLGPLPDSMAGQMVVCIAAPVLSLGGLVLVVLGFGLEALAHVLMAETDTAYYTAKREQGL